MFDKPFKVTAVVVDNTKCIPNKDQISGESEGNCPQKPSICNVRCLEKKALYLETNTKLFLGFFEHWNISVELVLPVQIILKGIISRYWEDNIKMGLQEVGWLAWTGLIWLRVGTGGRHFYMR
jgi:hypothetical protein